MKSLIATAALAAIAAAVVPAAASAQTAAPGAYGSIGYSAANQEGVDLGAIQGRLGYRFSPYLGVEGELAGGVKEDDTNIAGVPVDVKLEHQEAIYGVGFLPVAPNADLYARIGYGNTSLKVSGPGGVSATGDGDSWNYGVGGQYFFDDKNGVRADYTRFDFKDDNGEADVWSIGYVRKF
jgi:hypothetical protein